MSNISEEVAKKELECEDAILSDKQRFGRVRTNLMRQLRLKYGEQVANRALSRINKRISIGSVMIKTTIGEISESTNY